ncbi:hypothetical protein AB0C34_17245 [Nocardia sp. NPDC049220]|uniref:hypothetical protein n=1 Tax=Nocardia sp. NPDC049220 TaxID=3155273 RepID=UPI0034023860
MGTANPDTGFPRYRLSSQGEQETARAQYSRRCARHPGGHSTPCTHNRRAASEAQPKATIPATGPAGDHDTSTAPHTSSRHTLPPATPLVATAAAATSPDMRNRPPVSVAQLLITPSAPDPVRADSMEMELPL